jgi:hypothetical protein
MSARAVSRTASVDEVDRGEAPVSRPPRKVVRFRKLPNQLIVGKPQGLITPRAAGSKRLKRLMSFKEKKRYISIRAKPQDAHTPPNLL